jgi:hypothetical protein
MRFEWLMPPVLYIYTKTREIIFLAYCINYLANNSIFIVKFLEHTAFISFFSFSHTGKMGTVGMLNFSSRFELQKEF